MYGVLPAKENMWKNGVQAQVCSYQNAAWTWVSDAENSSVETEAKVVEVMKTLSERCFTQITCSWFMDLNKCKTLWNTAKILF